MLRDRDIATSEYPMSRGRNWQRARERELVLRERQPPKRDPASGLGAASEKQLRYLRSLAEQAGHTFVYPKNRREASAEITRLKKHLT